MKRYENKIQKVNLKVVTFHYKHWNLVQVWYMSIQMTTYINWT